MSDVSGIREVAPAKLNLALHVRARRADGYHDLETLFVFARDGDIVTVTPDLRDLLRIDGPFARGLDSGGDNLVVRAARAFRAVFGGGHHAILLDKQLPVAAGIGGGSADAAATLRALARLHDVAPDDARWSGIAAGLGADVPACLAGRAAFGGGRGDELSAVEGLGDMPALLVNPLVPVSTAAVFAGWDRVDRGALPAGGTLARAVRGRNDLYPAAMKVAPVIGDVVALLAAQTGVRLARMSGSGATCFALFANAGERDSAAAAVRARHPHWWQLSTSIA